PTAALDNPSFPTRRSSDLHTAVVHLFQLGFFSIVFMASCNTTLQLSAPDALRGRVMSFYTLAFGGAFPLGAFMIGAIAEALGVRDRKSTRLNSSHEWISYA